MAREAAKERAPTRPRVRERPPVNEIERTLAALGAKMPGVDEVAAIRAFTRGNATPGQQRLAATYLLGELCGVGKVTFSGEHTHGGAFRSGAQGVGVALAQIGGAVLMRFPVEGDERVPE